MVFFPTGKRADSARAYLAKIETEMSEGTDTGKELPKAEIYRVMRKRQ